MNNSPSRIPLTWIFLVGLVTCLFLFGPRAVMRADPAPTTNAPAAAVTKAVATAVTNAVSKAGASGETITIGDDDNDSPGEKGTKHDETIRITGGHGASAALMDDLIPILGILATFGTPILIVFCVSYFSYRRRAETLALAREYLSKGMPVPQELLDSTAVVKAVARARNVDGCCTDLRKGFKLTFIGLGVTLALYVFSPHDTDWAWGLIPMVMGIGYLISGWFETRTQGKLPESTPTRPPGNPL